MPVPTPASAMKGYRKRAEEGVEQGPHTHTPELETRREQYLATYIKFTFTPPGGGGSIVCQWDKEPRSK